MSKPWRAERIWPGETVTILGGGPSMSQHVADTVEGATRVIAVNNAFMLAPWADVLYAADAKWWKGYHTASKRVGTADPLQFKGLKVSIATRDGDRLNEFNDILTLRSMGEKGVERNPTGLRTCMNSGFQAINLAVHLGAAKILLCGFDMRDSSSAAHWHGEHIDSVKTTSIPVKAWISAITSSAKELEELGVEVINCTPRSGLRCFKSMPLEKAIESLHNDSRSTAISA